MLVLSRRPNQAVTFPGSATTVRVVSVKGNVVRLGIDAPPDVTILREELQPDAAARRATPDHGEPSPLTEQLRDRLKLTAANLGAVQLLLDAGCGAEAGLALSVVRDDLQVLRRALDGEEGAVRTTERRPSGRRRALLVEDDATQRELLAGYLRLAGLDVDTAGDGADALDYLHTHAKPDVVLLDMNLPRCDGATTARRIREDPALSDLRIVAVTGSAPTEFGAAGTSRIDHWFQKPIDPASLLRELRQEMEGATCPA